MDISCSWLCSYSAIICLGTAPCVGSPSADAPERPWALGMPLVQSCAQAKERWKQLARGLHQDRVGEGDGEQVIFEKFGMRATRSQARDLFIAAREANTWVRDMVEAGKEVDFA